jgi:hypothetical protein
MRSVVRSETALVVRFERCIALVINNISLYHKSVLNVYIIYRIL